ncbi:MAG: fatty acyl-AMP ligase, partial [Desulfuromonadales bacterium]|nr:fatty acyl-AMP ligase [Desulfuromonadales bacterium]NIR34111.1 fatty acyl-AMP ligase [Desulfuromonadales bacterium]NIS41567.1 fatty acyl-AMP ligase [Desulfuromonadales bacterium]
PAPNFAYEMCLNKLDEADLSGLDLSSLRCAFNGAEPVSPATLERFCEHFSSFGFRRQALMPVYGLAECSVGLAFPPLEREEAVVDRVDRHEFTSSSRAVPAGNDEDALSFAACGRPLPGHEIRVVDDKGRELPERREGRVQFRGPSASSGYYRNPEETEKLFDGDWLDTGDLGYVAEGDLFVTGRIKDVVIVGGRNVYPHELEEAAGEIEGVRKGNVAVIGA